MEIGSLIKARRQELGLTLEEVGDAVGVGKSTVRKWEQGMIKNMRRDKIKALAAVLGVDPVDFILPEQQQTTLKENDFSFTPISGLSEKEAQLLEAFRQADERSQQDALQMLYAHRRSDIK